MSEESSTFEIADSAKGHLEKLLSLLEIQGGVEEETIDESTICYRITCGDEDAKFLIGRKGQTLEALQYVLRQMCKGPEKEDEHFIVDVLDYRQRRKDSLIDKAKRAAVAVCNGEEEEFSLPPMTPFERRIVHNYLQENFPDLASESRGEGIDRHIVVSYAGLPEGGAPSAEASSEASAGVFPDAFEEGSGEASDQGG